MLLLVWLAPAFAGDDGPPYVAGVGDVGEPERIKYVEPIYPAEARMARISTKVILQALIDAEGNVSEVEVLLCKNPDLGFEEASIEAIKQWKYKPALKGGEPVAAFFQINIDYSLETKDVPERKARIEIVSISPVSQSVVSGDDVVRARLKYAIDDFDEDRHFFVTCLVLGPSGDSVHFVLPKKDAPRLDTGSGEIELTFSVDDILATKGQARPLVIRFSIHLVGELREGSGLIAMTDTVVYVLKRDGGDA